MKAIAISDISSGNVWSSDHASWHYSSKRSQNIFHPVNLPTEDRYSSRQSRVSRSLFGPSDPTESHRLAYEELNTRRCGDRSRWNFDFYQEKPMSGRYDWRKVCNKDKSRTPGDQLAESIWSSNKSPKKGFSSSSSQEHNYLDSKRTVAPTWKSETSISTRCAETKKKAY